MSVRAGDSERTLDPQAPPRPRHRAPFSSAHTGVAPWQPLNRREIGVALGCLLGVATAELITIWEPVFGIFLHLLLLTAFLVLALGEHGRGLPVIGLALAVAPTIRILSLTMPLSNFPQLSWHLIVSVPLFVMVSLIARALQIDRRRLGLVFDLSPVQWAIALIGLPLGLIQYLILRPEAALVPNFDWRLMWLPALALLISTGFLEELIFRGLLYEVATRLFGMMGGIAYVSALFGVLHLGYQSIVDLLFVLVVALVFGEMRRRTGTILGLAVAHGLTNITLFLIYPFLLN